MPELPKDWLGWVTLTGSIAGILAAGKLFLYQKWLNRHQRRLLVAAYLNDEKSVFAMKPLGGGWEFHIPNNKRSESYYNYFSTGGPDEVSSYQNLIYLKELVEKGYFVYDQESAGIENTYNGVYYLTAKGLRYGYLLRYITKEPKTQREQ